MKKLFYILFLFLIITSCDEDDLSVNPTSSLGSDVAIESIVDLRMATNNVYDDMMSSTYYQSGYLVAGDMLGDDICSPTFSSGWGDTYFTYSWTKISSTQAFFNKVYSITSHINDVMTKLDKVEESAEKDRCVAELKALRALVHFDLSKLYGPLGVNLGKGKIKTDALCIPIMEQKKEPKDYEGMMRRTVTEVYEFITTELEAALPNLDPARTNGTLSQDGARAALARIYLYWGKFDKAATHANKVIGSGRYQLIDRDNYLESRKAAYSTEAIFELDASSDDNAGINSIGYWVYVNNASKSEGYKEVAASPHFEELMKTDSEDVRFDQFVSFTSEKSETAYFPMNKYPGRSGDSKVNNIKVYGLSEMYLIASECALKTDKSEAARLLNELRSHRTTTAPNKFTASNITLEDILHERRIELVVEGHRAYDLWRNQLPVKRWKDLAEKKDWPYFYGRDISEGVIEFDNYKAILAINETHLELFPENLRDVQQNPGY